MKFRRTVLAALIAVSTALGMSIIVTPAHAGVTYIYPVYHYQVCQRQGHFAASFWNPWNPGSWYCYDISIPLGATYAGGLNIDGWCMAKYGGARATLVSNDVWGWRCVKRT